VSASNYPNDINSQSTLTRAQVLTENSASVNTDNYQYDLIGNLIRDDSAKISSITWTVYGKIKSITKTDGSIITYTYNSAGYRISKSVNNTHTVVNTYYVRDASGNTMAIYNSTDLVAQPIVKGQLFIGEFQLYGSNRLGIYNLNELMGALPGIATFTRGNKFFELSNHLGNVLVTVSDKKIPVNFNNNYYCNDKNLKLYIQLNPVFYPCDLNPGQTVDTTLIHHYLPDVVTANDYYPFGMQMPGRSYTQPNSSYRYGFNGQEKSNEIKGEGNSYTTANWEYDPRIGRRWNVDPIPKDDESPFMALGNNPIVMVDPTGEDWYKNGTTGNIEHKKWHGKHDGYELLGTGKTLDYKGYHYDKKGASQILENVIVTAKANEKPKKHSSWGGFYWNGNYNHEDVTRWDEQRSIVWNRLKNNQSLTQNGDPVELISLAGNYQSEWQANEEWRQVNYYILDFATMFVPVPKIGMLRWLKYGGRTFQEAKIAIWAKNSKPIFSVLRHPTIEGKTFKVFAEVHHRFIPQRWGFPNWITNSRLNLQITNSIEHSVLDSYRYQFLPKWVKEAVDAGVFKGGYY
jgi:RHS repeat-associated protein